MELNVIEEKARLVAYKTIEEKYNTADMKYDIWDWQEGVGAYGWFRYYKKTNDETILKFLMEYAEYHTKKGLGEITVNTVAPINLLLDLSLCKKANYYEIIEKYVNYCRYDALRTSDGVLVHSVIGKQFKHQIWSDTLFMGVLLMLRWGVYMNDKKLVDDVSYQIINHYKYLKDEQTGLLFHGYDESSLSHLSAVRWGRANGWGIVTSIEYLSMVKQKSAERTIIEQNLISHMNSLLKYIDDDGLFKTVLNDPSSPQELTISSCIFYGLKEGLKLKIFDDKYKIIAEKILNGLILNIDREGEVLKCSGGTPIMASAKEYCDIQNVMSYYSQGLAILALSSEVK